LTDTKPLYAPSTKVLAQSDLEQIHETSLRILEQVGVKFEDEAALKILGKNEGATVDGANVKLSRRLAEWTIDQAPGEFILRARNPVYDLTLGQRQILYTSAFGATFVCDAESET
jgi:trimethylamine--corrinoid protein Co-methyltransferase